MSDWLEHEAKAECLDLRQRRDELEAEVKQLREAAQERDRLIEAAAIQHLPTTRDANGDQWVNVPRWFVDALLNGTFRRPHQ